MGIITKCILDNNKQIVEYDAACQIGNRPYDPEKFEYMGDGVLYSVDGVLWKGGVRLSFFRVKHIKNYR